LKRVSKKPLPGQIRSDDTQSPLYRNTFHLQQTDNIIDKNVALLLAPGFEEAAAIVTLDILSRLGVRVVTLACHSTRDVTRYHNLKVLADDLLAHNRETLFDAVIIPGGPDGSKNLAANEAVLAFIRRHDQEGRLI